MQTAMTISIFITQAEIYLYTLIVKSIGGLSQSYHRLLEHLEATRQNQHHLILVQILVIALTGLTLGLLSGYLVTWFFLY